MQCPFKFNKHIMLNFEFGYMLKMVLEILNSLFEDHGGNMAYCGIKRVKINK